MSELRRSLRSLKREVEKALNTAATKVLYGVAPRERRVDPDPQPVNLFGKCFRGKRARKNKVLRIITFDEDAITALEAATAAEEPKPAKCKVSCSCFGKWRRKRNADTPLEEPDAPLVSILKKDGKKWGLEPSGNQTERQVPGSRV